MGFYPRLSHPAVALGDTAASTVDYRNAGTAEFLLTAWVEPAGDGHRADAACRVASLAVHGVASHML